jgi:exodeoxyribonuclease VII large subunit
VARAIVASRAPVVAGVGHETDFTIADFAADVRASTPTAAAALAVPDAAVWRDSLDATQQRLDQLIEAALEGQAERVSYTRGRLERASLARQIARARQRVDEAERALALRAQHALSLRRERVRAVAMRLHALSPLLTLARGFAVVRHEPGGQVVTSVGAVSPGQRLSVRVADGAFAAVVGPQLPDTALEVASDVAAGAARQSADTSRTMPRRKPVTARTARDRDGAPDAEEIPLFPEGARHDGQ